MTTANDRNKSVAAILDKLSRAPLGTKDKPSPKLVQGCKEIDRLLGRKVGSRLVLTEILSDVFCNNQVKLETDLYSDFTTKQVVEVLRLETQADVEVFEPKFKSKCDLDSYVKQLSDHFIGKAPKGASGVITQPKAVARALGINPLILFSRYGEHVLPRLWAIKENERYSGIVEDACNDIFSLDSTDGATPSQSFFAGLYYLSSRCNKTAEGRYIASPISHAALFSATEILKKSGLSERKAIDFITALHIALGAEDDYDTLFRKLRKRKQRWI